MTITASDKVILTGGLTVGTRTVFGASSWLSGEAQAYTSAAAGLVIAGKAGSSGDLYYINSLAENVFWNPTGTLNMVFAGGLTIGGDISLGANKLKTTLGEILVELGTGVRTRFADLNGIPTAANFQWDPAAGSGMEGFVYDYANGRLYWYGNGGVHYVTQTAGFELGHRECFRCGKLFKVGEEVSMVIDRMATDGIPHSVPIHKRCRKNRQIIAG